MQTTQTTPRYSAQMLERLPATLREVVKDEELRPIEEYYQKLGPSGEEGLSLVQAEIKARQEPTSQAS